MSSSTPRPRWRTLVLALALALVPGLAHAQSGSVRGTVAGRDGEALSGARVSVSGTRLSTFTDQLGAFTIRGSAAGTHQLRVKLIDADPLAHVLWEAIRKLQRLRGPTLLLHG